MGGIWCSSDVMNIIPFDESELLYEVPLSDTKISVRPYVANILLSLSMVAAVVIFFPKNGQV